MNIKNVTGIGQIKKFADKFNSNLPKVNTKLLVKNNKVLLTALAFQAMAGMALVAIAKKNHDGKKTENVKKAEAQNIENQEIYQNETAAKKIKHKKIPLMAVTIPVAAGLSYLVLKNKPANNEDKPKKTDIEDGYIPPENDSDERPKVAILIKNDGSETEGVETSDGQILTYDEFNFPHGLAGLFDPYDPYDSRYSTSLIDSPEEGKEKSSKKPSDEFQLKYNIDKIEEDEEEDEEYYNDYLEEYDLA